MIPLIHDVPQMLPDIWIRYFWPESGFPKTSFLKSTHVKKFFGENFFPDKNRPGSGFSLNYPVFWIFFNLPFKYSQINHFWWSPLKTASPDFPGFPYPVIWPESGFWKTLNLKSTNVQKCFGDIFFPSMKLSRIRFFPNLTGFPDFL